jgi:hypothetical protein
VPDSSNGGQALPKHLEFIQAVIARMSASSGLAKAWALTVATGTFGYAVTKNADGVAWLGMFAIVMFGSLDARYLREERKYRALFRAVRRGEVEIYDMDARSFSDRKSLRFDRECSLTSVARSWSLWLFYVPILVLGVIVLLTNLNPGEGSERESPPTLHPSDPLSTASPEARFGLTRLSPSEGRHEHAGA